MGHKIQWMFEGKFTDGKDSFDIPPIMTKIDGRPSLTIHPLLFRQEGKTMWIPGKSSWNALTTTFIGNDNIFVFGDLWPHVKGDITLTLLNWSGEALELWKLKECQIVNVSWGDFSNTLPMVDVTWRYANCSLESKISCTIEKLCYKINWGDPPNPNIIVQINDDPQEESIWEGVW